MLPFYFGRSRCWYVSSDVETYVAVWDEVNKDKLQREPLRRYVCVCVLIQDDVIVFLLFMPCIWTILGAIR